MDFRRQYADISGIPCFVLEGARAGKRRRWLAKKAEQNRQCDETSNHDHRHLSRFEFSEFALGRKSGFRRWATMQIQPMKVSASTLMQLVATDILNDRYRVTGRE